MPFTTDLDESEANMREGVLAPWNEKALMWLGGLCLTVILVRAVLDPKPFWPLPPGWWIGAIFGLFGVMFGRLSGAAHRGTPVRAATLLAFGYCGCCGYTLRELPDEADGCRSCPECGHAWNSQRFTRIEQSKQAAFNRLQQLNGFHFSLIPLTDDRRVLLAEPYRWPDRRVMFVPAAAKEVRRRLDSLLWRQRLLLNAILWTLWGAAVVLTLAATNPIGDALGGVFAVSLITVVLSLASLALVLRPTVVRRTILASSQCPGCWMPLTGEPRFDGCTECPTCRSAWRADETGPAAPRS